MATYNYVVVLDKADSKAFNADINAVTKETHCVPRRTSTVTPDNTYVALAWYDIDLDGPAVQSFNHKIDGRRHARAVINLETCMPAIDTKSSDKDGCDEEFDTILSLKTTVSLNRMSGRSVKICGSDL